MHGQADQINPPLPLESMSQTDGYSQFTSSRGSDELDRAFGQQLFMYRGAAATAFEDTTQGQHIYVTLPERSQPSLLVPYASQHRFGPVLRFVASN